ncbi:XVIPCD domain-containing protein [Stenotrophomonas sp. 278]|uniref:XVIPCD domain-containing protein n=1 Tax=Stenotrophomonas sp. 278 TaxID=2479851 RepID=UPI000F67F8FA|nr:XVIPCD domain-containing protein [Stenotrophomonas sp. 278]
MTGKAVLGIHSQVDSRTEGSFNQFIDGHAWLTISRNGQTQFYGLWPDNHPRTPDNGAGSDIRVGMEARFRPDASRYFALNEEQIRHLEAALSENVDWGYTNTCASWATDTLHKVTGQKLEASEFVLTDTPRELIDAIRKAERLQPTSPTRPHPPVETPPQPSSARSLSDISQRLHQQAIEGVHRLDASLGRAPDAASERMAASLAHLARATGFSQIDHVLLGRPTDVTPESQNVFIVQGMLGDASHRRAYISVPEALREPANDSLQKLQDLDATLAAELEAREMGIEVVRRRV